LWLSLTRRYIAGCISYMPLIVTVNMVVECLRTDCNSSGEKFKKCSPWGEKLPDTKVYHSPLSSAGVKNEWNYTSTPLYKFMAYLFIYFSK
jgi:hypothetical protein